MDDHDQGLSHDLKMLAAMTPRRKVLRWVAGASLLPVLGCGGDDLATGTTGAGGTSGAGGSASTGGSSGSGGTLADSGGTQVSSCSKIPEETAGPYPGDGSNGVNALVLAGIVRTDIRPSFGSATGTAKGVPLTVNLTLVNTNGSCGALSGYAVYIWHCDRDGNYSLYTVQDQNYLRGVQATNANGTVTFSTIFPACYSGRWPHIHFEVYRNVAEATSAGTRLATSQLALPADICNRVFATTGYSASVSNFAQTSLATDMVFSDGSASQVPTMSGSVTAGYVASLIVGVAA
jgi:protocatechuate 3,4-dioxygenase beta subunit